MHFEQLPDRGSVPIEEAIKAGKIKIQRPAFLLTVIGSLTGLALLFLSYVWVGLIVFVVGFIAGYFFTLATTPAWRNWAYSGVQDIHQLQRSAELARLLPPHSFDKPFGWMSYGQIQTLSVLCKRFETDAPFEDNPDIPPQIMLALPGYPFRRMGMDYVCLSKEGIRLSEKSFYSWGEVQKPEVVYKSYSRNADFTHTTEFNLPSFCFSCQEGYIEITIKDTEDASLSLDYLLYIYQGRYHARKSI